MEKTGGEAVVALVGLSGSHLGLWNFWSIVNLCTVGHHLNLTHIKLCLNLAAIVPSAFRKMWPPGKVARKIYDKVHLASSRLLRPFGQRGLQKYQILNIDLCDTTIMETKRFLTLDLLKAMARVRFD